MGKREVMKILILLLLLLSGCSMLDKAVDVGAKANDELVDNSITTICNIASVGSIKRKFNTKQLKDIWNELCATEDFKL